jgi:ferric iron reductase protein FhuF
VTPMPPSSRAGPPVQPRPEPGPAGTTTAATPDHADSPVHPRPEAGPPCTGLTEIRVALGSLIGPAPHLRWRIAEADVPLGADELSCAALAHDSDALAAAVAASGKGRGSDDPQVLASLWWQAYAYRVAGTALACWLLTGVAPDVRAESMAIGVARSRPSSVVYLTVSRPPGTARPTGDVAPAGHDQPHDHDQPTDLDRPTDLDQFVDRVFAGHLDLVAARLRARYPVGAQLVWGNVAAACASGVGAVHAAADPDWPERLRRFLAIAPHRLASLGDWSFPATGPTFQRHTCCLWWKTSVAGGALCADCSLHRSSAVTDERRRRGTDVVARNPQSSHEDQGAARRRPPTSAASPFSTDPTPRSPAG